MSVSLLTKLLERGGGGGDGYQRKSRIKKNAHNIADLGFMEKNARFFRLNFVKKDTKRIKLNYA